MIITVKKLIENETSKNNFMISKNLLTLNLKNLGFIKFLKSEDDLNYLEIQYKKRATFKNIKFIMKHSEADLISFFKNNNFFRLEKYFINISQIAFVDEDRHEDEIKLTFYFIDGQELIIKTKFSRWENWKALRL